MLQVVIFGLFALVLGAADAQNLPANVVYRAGIEEIALEEALAQVQPGQVIVLGEEHGAQAMADQQLQVLETLRKKGHRVSVGMEFFAYPFQAQVDQWRQGQLKEAEFLKQIAWGTGISFSFYRPQVQFPRVNEEFVVALNAPRSLTGRISKVGIEGLTPDELALMPPNFTIGNEKYFERFRKVMEGPHQPSEESIRKFFAAQSTWDDTMAWKAAEFLKAQPDQFLVIIVGEFHVQYGGGLPDRLKARGVPVTSFSLVNLEGLSDVEQRDEVQPSSEDGQRADFVWTSRFPRSVPAP